MLKNFILNNTDLSALTKGMDVYALREKVIASNIANVGTPGYKRLTVNFEENLKSAVVNMIENSHEEKNFISLNKNNSISNSHPKVTLDNSKDLKSGINNVDVEEEMVEMAKNQIRFMYATRMASRGFASIRASIKGRS